jgi:transcriptional regulator with XRE-family HTH domain
MIEEFQKDGVQGVENLGMETEPFGESKTKTSLRMQYEAECKVIRSQIGDLETIRMELGLSRRKICRLLMVDPSAWTRWVKGGAPPHIYRALQWYMALIEKSPSWHPQNAYLGAIRSTPESLQRIENLEVKVESWINQQGRKEESVQDSLARLRLQISDMGRGEVHWVWKLFLIFNFLAVIVLLFR